MRSISSRFFIAALAGAATATIGLTGSTAAQAYEADEAPIQLSVSAIPKSSFGTFLRSMCGALSTKAFPSAATTWPPARDVETQMGALIEASGEAEAAGQAAAGPMEALEAADAAVSAAKKAVRDATTALTNAKTEAAKQKAQQALAAAEKDLQNKQDAWKAADTAAAPTRSTLEAKSKAVRAAVDALLPVLKGVASTCAKLRVPAHWTTLDANDLALLRALHELPTFPVLADRVEFGLGNVTPDSNEERKLIAIAEAFNAKFRVATPSFVPPEILGGLSSKVIDGLADFLVTRSKQEAVLFLQEQVEDRICNPEFMTDNPGPVLLPNTCQAFENIDASISLNAMGVSLNKAARADLVVLPDSLMQYATKKDPRHHYFYEPARLLYASALAVHAERHGPLDVIAWTHRIPMRKCEENPSTEEGKTCKSIFKALRVGSALVYSLVQQAPEFSTEDLAHADQWGPRVIALALDLESNLKVAKVLPATGFELPRLTGNLEKIRNIANAAHKVQVTIETLVKLQEDEAGTLKSETPEQQRARIAKAVLLAVGLLLDDASALLPLVEDLPDPATAAAAQARFKTAFDLLSFVARIGRSALEEDVAAITVETSRMLSALNERRWKDGESIDDRNLLKALLPIVSKYTPLIVEIASAKSSKDVASAFEAAAAPVGSYKVKFERPTIALNAFVGAFVGEERIQKGNVKDASPTFAMFAPVGVHLSYPTFRGVGPQIGAMLSVLDLGTLTQQRFDDELKDENEKDVGTTEKTANVSLTQVFSPGAYVTVAIANRNLRTPITLGFGASFVPNLRAVTLEDELGTVQDTASVLRWGGFVAFDLTLLPLN